MGIMTTIPASIRIIGFGNPQRRDDGIGVQVAHRLGNRLAHQGNIHVQGVSQLDPALAADLKDASAVLFIDATVTRLTGGWQCRFVSPQRGPGLWDLHDITPAQLLGLVQACFGRCPSAWMISVQGDDFAFGETLSPAARRRSDQVVAFIFTLLQAGSPAEFVLTGADPRHSLRLVMRRE